MKAHNNRLLENISVIRPLKILCTKEWDDRYYDDIEHRMKLLFERIDVAEADINEAIEICNIDIDEFHKIRYDIWYAGYYWNEASVLAIEKLLFS